MNIGLDATLTTCTTNSCCDVVSICPTTTGDTSLLAQQLETTSRLSILKQQLRQVMAE